MKSSQKTVEVKGFKQTEIGLIPEDWNIGKLGNFCKVVRGASPRPVGDKRYYFGHIPRLMVEDVTRDGMYVTPQIQFLTDAGANLSRPMGKGSLVIQVSGNPGTPCILSVDACIHDGFAGLVDLNDTILHREFIYFFLLKYKGDNSRLATGSIFKNLQTSIIKDFYVPLLHIKEQKKISFVISKFQNSIEHQNKIIEKAKELKKSLMNKLFTEGLNGEEQKETEIGKIPKNWDVVKIDNVIDKTKQVDPGKNPNLSFRYIDVSSVSNDTFKITEFTEYKGSDAPSRARKLVQAGDVIVATVRPTLKRIAFIDKTYNGYICSTAFCVLRGTKNKSHGLFLYYSVQRDVFIDELSKIQRGVSYPAVSDGDIKNQTILLPPFEEQQKIASILSKVDDKIQKEQKRKESLQNLFKSMLQLLMTGQVRVKDIDFEVK